MPTTTTIHDAGTIELLRRKFDRDTVLTEATTGALVKCDSDDPTCEVYVLRVADEPRPDAQ